VDGCSYESPYPRARLTARVATPMWCSLALASVALCVCSYYSVMFLCARPTQGIRFGMVTSPGEALIWWTSISEPGVPHGQQPGRLTIAFFRQNEPWPRRTPRHPWAPGVAPRAWSGPVSWDRRASLREWFGWGFGIQTTRNPGTANLDMVSAVVPLWAPSVLATLVAAGVAVRGLRGRKRDTADTATY
jgi:hypothetical protein